MTAPAYATDLVTLNTAEVTTGFAEPGTWTAGGLPAAEADYFIQGTGCISKTYNATGLGGLVYTAGAGVTIPADGAMLAWQYFACPNALDVDANGGIRLVIGSSASAFNAWNLGGRDSYTYGGWQCLAANPTVAADYTVGAPTSTRLTFGWAANVSNAVAKGNPFGLDALRYGRCTLESTGGDLANGYATFAGAAAVNDNVSNRWGLCQYQDGAYKLQGHFKMGGATTAVDFRDSNKSVVILNTKKVTSAFNLMEVVNVASRVDWTNISVQALGTVSRGNFKVTDNATVNLNGCTFTDCGTFDFLGLTAVANTTFRRCNAIIPAGATMTNCTIASSNDANGALVINSSAQMDALSKLNLLSNAKAIKITAAGVYTFNGHAFTDNAVQVDFTGTGTCTINPTNGCNVSQAACIASGGGTVTVNAVQYSFTATIKNEAGASLTDYEYRLYVKDATVGIIGTTELTGEENRSTSTFAYTYAYTGDQTVVLQVLKDGYEEFLNDFTLGNTNQVVSVVLRLDTNL